MDMPALRVRRFSLPGLPHRPGKAAEQRQKLLLHPFERAHCIIRPCEQIRLLRLCLSQQTREIPIQHGMIDPVQIGLLFVRERRAEITAIDQFQQTVLIRPVIRQNTFERARDVGQIALARVMKQAGERETGRISSRLRLPGTGDAVLSHRIECPHLSVASADQRQRVRNIPDINQIRIRMNRIEAFSGVCRDGRLSFLAGHPVFHRPFS